MLSDSGAHTRQLPPVPDDHQIVRSLVAQIAAQLTLTAASELLASRVARLLATPLALLSRDPMGWRFEAHAFPPAGEDADSQAVTRFPRPSDSTAAMQDDAGQPWTVVSMGALGERDWALLLPGDSDHWAARKGFTELAENLASSLTHVAQVERANYMTRFQRRLYAFAHKLARESDPRRLYRLILTTMASQTEARTSALAIVNPEEDALQIVDTIGYPMSLVEHLRIAPGEGLIGRVFETRKALIGEPDPNRRRRLRYRTDSYMVAPILAGDTPLAIVSLTDKANGGPFDARDLSSVRVMASIAASALNADRVRSHLVELTNLATVDAVTNLFNRRYFEIRLEGEIERARRQGHDLALLLIDIDDFKAVNDTRGHLEGDRILRDVADLLRAGVRIFDICARYGGEEFVIVMPGATLTVAQQVAERIRARIERNFRTELPAITVSVGIGMLDTVATADALVDAADHALISAKRSGKNLVRTNASGER